MAAGKVTVPNWAQKLIAAAANLNTEDISVRIEDDRLIAFIRHTDRREILVNKVTGDVIES